ncbi:conserved domain protein [Acaryochloris marina MBIC11017]|uniref:Conserved domain protein n=1 Tax=Acaryochloris marina (strain MBIC 11017) TaxID=329726 RepID=B0CDW1_ACAM1|nr:conserved domain protein [Acaryochloris marina MBIC11017]
MASNSKNTQSLCLDEEVRTIQERLQCSNGELLATLGKDGMARVWDLQGRQIAQYKASRFAINSDWSKIATVQQPNAFRKQAEIIFYRMDGLEGLLARGCRRLHWYLVNSQQVTDEERAACNL